MKERLQDSDYSHWLWKRERYDSSYGDVAIVVGWTKEEHQKFLTEEEERFKNGAARVRALNLSFSSRMALQRFGVLTVEGIYDIFSIGVVPNMIGPKHLVEVVNKYNSYVDAQEYHTPGV